MKTNIVVIGFMGTGKTTNGRRLARKLGKQFIDTDLWIEKNHKMKIEDIFKQFGEPYFREIEEQTVKEISKMNNKVISTGGGVILNPKNIQHLRKNGIIVLLESTPECIIRNLKNSYRKRPLLEKQNWQREVEILLAERKYRYHQSADFVVKVDQKKHYQIVNEIAKTYHIKK